MDELKLTRKEYEQFQNELSPEQGSDEWIIGGKIRMYHMWRKQYGTAIRKYDPIGFTVGYNDWVRDIEFKRENEKK